MGMAASQARLLTITARMHDVEYQAQCIQNAKIQLANQEDAVYQRYLEALDATTFTVKDNNGNRIVANFNTLCGIDAVNASPKTRYVLRDQYDRIIVSDDVASGYEAFKSKGGNAYEFALFMMEGHPADFDAGTYQQKAYDILNEKSDTGNLGKMQTICDTITEYLYQIQDKFPENGTSLTEFHKNGDNEKDIKNRIREKISEAIESITKNSAISNITDEKTISDVKELIDKVNASYEEMEYMLYTQSGEDIYAIEGNRKEDFDNDDFWGYVNMYKQIEANGGRYVKISEFDGVDGIGDASTDTDWLQSQVQSGKITIDISTLDSKGNLSFKSTAVSSDSALEYTTTTTIDKAAAAKAEAEYEHKMKEIDRKDKKFDMDLNKLETERTALKTEYDSVKKVIEDNIERTFGIFS